MSFYDYLFTKDDNGVGVSNLAFKRSQNLPIYSIYGTRYNVKKSLAPTAMGRMKITQNIPTVPIEGNGLYLNGQFALQSLYDAEREAKK